MENFWIINVFQILKELSDLEFQKEVWLGKSNKVSSYNELITSLYDDNFFEDFIDNEFWSNCKKEIKPLQALLIELNELLNNYKPHDLDENILADPQWHKIVFKANEIVKFWIVIFKH